MELVTWQDGATMSVLNAHPTITYSNAPHVAVKRRLKNNQQQWTSATLPQPAAISYFSDNLRGIDIMYVRVILVCVIHNM